MDNMLGKIVRKLVTLSDEVLGVVFDLLEKLGSGQGGEWLAMLKKFLRKEACWVQGTAKTVQKAILELSGIVTVSIPAGEFIVGDHFRVDTSNEAEVKICYLGDNFQKWFLGKSEKQAGGKSTLRIHRLTRAEVNGPIINELGGETKAGTTLAEIFALMKKQGESKKRVLLTNGYGYVNIFYVRDVNGVLCTVDLDWRNGGWHVGTDSVADPYRWSDGHQILSRNS